MSQVNNEEFAWQYFCVFLEIKVSLQVLKASTKICSLSLHLQKPFFVTAFADPL
ncbi:hypothetical protein H9649_17025 [Sporosarcina sp. Sa2YVA2]|uniref:Uncharacterized protein n=1 Tax=Sporosarcina quadrami TaxID=2762234 RepID=A0ABR8UE47_9BACL|nr:hypothetical protein [Sporosarcina quadrami]MBD7986276.1 hypothetical protein [Sporosarcina quadrami]